MANQTIKHADREGFIVVMLLVCYQLRVVRKVLDFILRGVNSKGILSTQADLNLNTINTQTTPCK